jgi:ribosomal protein S18 acetylase RimI-like enzyme
VTDIRPATLEDVAAIAEIHVRTWQVAYADIFPPVVLGAQSVDERAAMWTRTLANPAFDVLVAEDKAICGFVCLGPSERVPGTGEIWAIYVDPSAWRRGVGSMLLDRAVERLTERGFAEAVLETLARSTQSCGFYESHGWEAGETRREEFRGVPEELVLYRLSGLDRS